MKRVYVRNQVAATAHVFGGSSRPCEASVARWHKQQHKGFSSQVESSRMMSPERLHIASTELKSLGFWVDVMVSARTPKF